VKLNKPQESAAEYQEMAIFDFSLFVKANWS